jgi:hypothetical protein
MFGWSILKNSKIGVELEVKRWPNLGSTAKREEIINSTRLTVRTKEMTLLWQHYKKGGDDIPTLGGSMLEVHAVEF